MVFLALVREWRRRRISCRLLHSSLFTRSILDVRYSEQHSCVDRQLFYYVYIKRIFFFSSFLYATTADSDSDCSAAMKGKKTSPTGLFSPVFLSPLFFPHVVRFCWYYTSVHPSVQSARLEMSFSFPFSRSPHRQFWLKLLLGRPRFVFFIFLPWSRFILLLLLLLIERPPFFLFNALRHLIINRPSVSYIYVLVVCGVLRACVRWCWCCCCIMLIQVTAARRRSYRYRWQHGVTGRSRGHPQMGMNFNLMMYDDDNRR